MGAKLTNVPNGGYCMQNTSRVCKHLRRIIYSTYNVLIISGVYELVWQSIKLMHLKCVRALGWKVSYCSAS